MRYLAYLNFFLWLIFFVFLIKIIWQKQTKYQFRDGPKYEYILVCWSFLVQYVLRNMKSLNYIKGLQYWGNHIDLYIYIFFLHISDLITFIRSKDKYFNLCITSRIPHFMVIKNMSVLEEKVENIYFCLKLKINDK